MVDKKNNSKKNMKVEKKEDYDDRSFEEKEMEITEKFEKAVSRLSLLL